MYGISVHRETKIIAITINSKYRIKNIRI